MQGKLTKFEFSGRTYVSGREVKKRFDDEIDAGERVVAQRFEPSPKIPGWSHANILSILGVLACLLEVGSKKLNHLKRLTF